jgi:hypothetical protein
MESEDQVLRSRKQLAMKPIRTKTENGEDGREDHLKKQHDHEVVEEEPLSPSARLFHEPNFNVYIIAIMGSKTKIQLDIVKANLEHTLLKHPRFSSLQVRKFIFNLTYIWNIMLLYKL